MYDTYQMQEHICKELEKKGQNGLKSTQDLDTVWKLIDAYKNLLKIDMLQEAGEYSHDDGYSERRKRDSRGRYSRSDGYDRGSSYNQGGYSEARERYMDDKHSYRSTRSAESKRDMNVSLHDCMSKLKDELQEMMSSADSREERDKIKEMLREIGNLA
jgi:hypothetical protein